MHRQTHMILNITRGMRYKPTWMSGKLITSAQRSSLGSSTEFPILCVSQPTLTNKQLATEQASGSGEPQNLSP